MRACRERRSRGRTSRAPLSRHWHCRCECVPVGSPKPLGVAVTRRTRMLKVGMRAAAQGMRVADVMTSDVVFLRTQETLDEAWQILHFRGISGAPVLSHAGRL